jgi:hypothetical protein
MQAPCQIRISGGAADFPGNLHAGEANCPGFVKIAGKLLPPRLAFLPAQSDFPPDSDDGFHFWKVAEDLPIG